MRKRRLVSLISTLAILASLVPVGATVVAGDGETRSIPASGTTSIRPGALGSDALAQPEFRLRRSLVYRPDLVIQSEDLVNRLRPEFQSGIFPKKPLDAPVVPSSVIAGANPEVVLGVNGLNHRDQRLANGGNQFSLEPPDQALCVGNGFVVESTNSVLRVRSASNGAALTGVQDLNTFFGYAAAINRTTGEFGPFVIDPVCLYDPDNNRFMVVITTLHQTLDGFLTGRNTIDLAVTNTGDPTGTWTIYSVPAQNDGTEGTPDHGCTLDGTTPGPCFQDYPHIGADLNGVYVSTNEYDLVGPAFSAAQIFAFSKAQLAAHPAEIDVTLVENLSVDGSPGFTVWPAISPAGEYEMEQNGTEYFLSTVAGDGSESGNPTGTARRLGLWALTNTASLNTSDPDLRMSSRSIKSQVYVFPPTSDQKPGNTPLRECINDTTMATPFGPGCWQFFFLPEDEPAHDEVQSRLDSLDSRMQQTWFVNGMIWGSSGTAVRVGGELRAGIAWFAVDPKLSSNGTVNGKVERQGYLALDNNHLSMPAIAMGTDGQGAIAFTVVGETHYPSAGYVTISANGAVGPIHIAAAGLGPSDGFTSYKAFVGDPPRTRWGDYGAAVTDGQFIWIASEYIAQTCTLAEYANPPTFAGFGSCGATRTSLANWATFITKLNP